MLQFTEYGPGGGGEKVLLFEFTNDGHEQREIARVSTGFLYDKIRTVGIYNMLDYVPFIQFIDINQDQLKDVVLSYSDAGEVSQNIQSAITQSASYNFDVQSVELEKHLYSNQRVDIDGDGDLDLVYVGEILDDNNLEVTSEQNPNLFSLNSIASKILFLKTL